MNILITGSTGFVGRSLKKHLSDTNPDITIHELPRNALAETENELKEVLSILKIDKIVHIAGKAHDLKNSTDKEAYYQINFGLTKKIYNAFLDSTARCFIFISSVKAVADNVDGYLTEDFKPSPATDYGKSKLKAEQYIQTTILPDGKSFYILRPSLIHGPGNKGNLVLLYKIARLGLPYPLAAFENKRSFLGIHNFCFVIQQLLLRNDIPTGVYHVADDAPISTNRLMILFSEGLSQKNRLLRINKNYIAALAKVGDKLHLPFNTERLKKLTENYVVCNKKILKAIGKPFPVSTEDGLRITIQSFIENKKI